MKTVLVTGAAGFIGSNLCIALQEKGYYVIAVDDLSSGTILNLNKFKGLFIRERVSGCRLFNLHSKYKFDNIYHLAATSDTRSKGEASIVSNNYAEFEEIFKELEDSVKVIYASSAAVYGNSNPPQRETDIKNPLNAYGVTKSWMEELAKEQQNTTLGLRYFNVFGPNEFHKKSYANMVTQIILKASRGEEIRLFRSGEQRRDEIYVKDAVAATIYLGEKKLPQKHTVVNIGVGQAETFNNIIFEVSQILDKDIKPMFINNPYSSFYQENTKADITLLKKLGFKHKYTFRQGLKEYIHWLKEVKVIK